MLAVQQALEFSRTTVKKGLPPRVRLQGVIVLSESPTVAQLLNHHLVLGLDSLEEVDNTKDREMIKKVLLSAQLMLHHGLDISVCPDGRAEVDEGGG
jgi:hypothetical protein